MKSAEITPLCEYVLNCEDVHTFTGIYHQFSIMAGTHILNLRFGLGASNYRYLLKLYESLYEADR